MYQEVIECYPDLWEDAGHAIDMLLEDFMPVPLKDNWQNKRTVYKMYPLSATDRHIIDAQFSKLHEQSRISWITQPMPFGFPMFMAWHVLPDGERKGQPVVDIHSLNKLTVVDEYPLPRQEDIIAKM